MESRYLAEEFGQRLADGAVAHVLSREANLTSGPIMPFPVGLEPPFARVDPLQTYTATASRSATASTAATGWKFRRFFLPRVSAVDWRRAETLVSALAGVRSPMSFEVVVHGQHASLYVGAPQEQLAFVASTWLAVYPDAVLVDATDPLATLASGELVLFDWYTGAPYHRAIRASQAVSAWASFFALCTSLTPTDVAFCQIVFQATMHAWQENIAAIVAAEHSLRHRTPHGCSVSVKNLADPLYAASIRMGTTRSSLASSMRSLTGLLTVDGHCFRARTIDEYLRVVSVDQVLAMVRERTTHTVGQLLTSAELSLLVHLPDLGARGPVQLDLIEGLPVPPSLRAPGLALGVNTTRGVPVPVYQPLDQTNRSAWYLGSSRKGKSTALLHKVRSLVLRGEGVGVIDAHRTLVFDILQSLHDVDASRLIWWDFDASLPLAYNAFANHDPSEYGRLATEYVHAFKRLFDTDAQYRTMHLLGNIVYALLVLGENLARIPALVARTAEGEALRSRVIRGSPNDAVRHFWQEEFPRITPVMVSPIISRIAALLLDDRTQRTFAQTDSRIDPARLIDEGNVVLIAPPASIDAASLVIGFLLAQFKDAALRRAGTTRAKAHFHLVIDEFHRFIQSANALQSVLDETAKGGLSVSLANQETGQLPNDLLKALLSVQNILVFGVNLQDAKTLAPLFHGQVAPETLAGLGTGSVYARIGAEIVTFQTPPPPLNVDHDAVARVLANNQAFYATPNTVQQQPHAGRVIETLTEE